MKAKFVFILKEVKWKNDLIVVFFPIRFWAKEENGNREGKWEKAKAEKNNQFLLYIQFSLNLKSQKWKKKKD